MLNHCSRKGEKNSDEEHIPADNNEDLCAISYKISHVSKEKDRQSGHCECEKAV